MSAPILTARGLVQSFPGGGLFGRRRKILAIRNVDLDVLEGETLAIVGESGSGKSTLARLLLRLAKPDEGTISYRGRPLEGLDSGQRHQYRRDVQAVFQDPASSLNPRMRIEQTLTHVIRRHGLAVRETARELIAEQLRSVGLVPPEDYMTRYPHQLSGGQQQRIAIARAMILKPRLIIADEPLSSLDISVQVQLLDLIAELRRKTGVGFVVITHDLNAVQAIADRIVVMYRGRVVETGRHVLTAPRHPYTQMLIDAKLIPNPRLARAKVRAVQNTEATATQGDDEGCRFRPRCSIAVPVCKSSDPPLESCDGNESAVACHLARGNSLTTCRSAGQVQKWSDLLS